MPITLAEDELHLWCISPDALREPALAAGALGMMNDEERARGARFVFERHRRLHAATRALVRTTLSRYAPVAPASWIFRQNEYGRPEVDAPAAWRHVRFNLSNTDGLVVCLVGHDREIGVDVERPDREVEFLAVARSHFAPPEFADVAAAADERKRRERFFAYWTLKEAYIKARGMGLALPLDGFWFARAEGRAPTVTIGPALGDDGARWQFAELRPTRDHVGAFAVERRRDDARVVRFDAPLDFG